MVTLDGVYGIGWKVPKITPYQCPPTPLLGTSIPVLCAALGPNFPEQPLMMTSPRKKRLQISPKHLPGTRLRSQGDTLGSWTSDSLAVLLGIQDPKGGHLPMTNWEC